MIVTTEKESVADYVPHHEVAEAPPYPVVDMTATAPSWRTRRGTALRWLLLTFLLGLLVTFSSLRLWKLDQHVGTQDDLSIPAHYLEAIRAHQLDSLRAKSGTVDYSTAGIVTRDSKLHYWAYKSVHWLDRLQVLGLSQPLFQYAAKALAVPTYGNHAPIQFLLGAWLVDAGMSYNEIKFWSRLPSTLASVAVLALVPLLSRRLSRNHFSVAPLLSMAIVACSWQQFWISRQAQPTAAGVLAVLVLALNLILNSRFRFKYQPAWQEGVLIGALALVHHQVLFFMPAYYGSAVIFANGTAPLSWRVRRAMWSLLWSLVIIVPIYSWLQLNPVEVAPWAVAKWNAYLFNLPTTDPWWQQVLYVIEYFIVGLWQVAGANTGFLPYDLGMQWWAAAAVMFAAAGWYHYARQPHAMSRAFSAFVALAAATFLVLICLGITTLSPDEQTVCWAPFFAILIANGVGQLVRRLLDMARVNRYYDGALLAVMTGLAILVLLGHFTYYRYMRYQWADTYGLSLQAVIQLQRQYPSSLLVSMDYDMASQVCLTTGSALASSDGPIRTVRLNNEQDARQSIADSTMVNGLVVADYCTIIAPNNLDDSSRLSQREWLSWWVAKHKVDKQFRVPVLLAEHTIMRQQVAGYFPAKQCKPLGHTVFVLGLTEQAEAKQESLLARIEGQYP